MSIIVLSLWNTTDQCSTSKSDTEYWNPMTESMDSQRDWAKCLRMHNFSLIATHRWSQSCYLQCIGIIISGVCWWPTFKPLSLVSSAQLSPRQVCIYACMLFSQLHTNTQLSEKQSHITCATVMQTSVHMCLPVLFTVFHWCTTLWETIVHQCATVNQRGVHLIHSFIFLPRAHMRSCLNTTAHYVLENGLYPRTYTSVFLLFWRTGVPLPKNPL